MAAPDCTTPKQCSKCKEFYPLTSEFWYRQKGGRDGFNAQCKLCIRAYDALPENKARRKVNDQTPEAKARARARRKTPEQIKREHARDAKPERQAYKRDYNRSDRGRASQKRHRDKPGVRESQRNQLRLKRLNPEYVKREREVGRIYRAKPGFKERQHIKNVMRRTRLANAGGFYSAEDVKLQYQTQIGKCWWCGCELTDKWHVDHRVPLSKGGANNVGNIVIACPKCNLSKGAKLPHEFNGRLL